MNSKKIWEIILLIYLNLKIVNWKMSKKIYNENFSKNKCDKFYEIFSIYLY